MVKSDEIWLKLVKTEKNWLKLVKLINTGFKNLYIIVKICLN